MLQRYEIDKQIHKSDFVCMNLTDKGDFCKYEDVEKLLLNLYKQCIGGFVYPSQIPNDEKLKANIERFLKTNRLN